MNSSNTESVVMWGVVMLLGTCAAAGDAAAVSPQASGVEVRDALLLLDDGPLHLRMHLMLNGQTLQAAREAYVDRLITSLDTNHDGKLTASEMSRSPLLTTRRRSSANEFLNSLQAEERTVPRTTVMQAVERVGGESVVYRQDVSSASTDDEVFKFLDGDTSGLVDRKEMLAAANKILERDQDGDECVSFQEFLPPPDPNDMAVLLNQPPEQPGRPQAQFADQLRDTQEPRLPQRLIKKYDKNRDEKLSPAELGWKTDRVKPLDADKDGLLSERELARVRQARVDLELAVEMTGPAKDQPALKILQTTGTPGEASKRTDYVRLNFAGAVVTIAFRQVDPIPAAIDNAKKQFNRLDVDANGYLDAMETAQRIRFERGLFDAMDADGDGKIFGEEMEKYVAARGEPAATTARVNLYDTGRGFFHSLDRNGDGRISMREMRTADKSLTSMERDKTLGLSPTEPVRHFHLEFVRGSFQLFGPTDQMISMTPSFEQRPMIGPVWFQRMDRNSDGDLTWNEFLGPRNVFHRLDADRDSLIDPTEAERANQ